MAKKKISKKFWNWLRKKRKKEEQSLPNAVKRALEDAATTGPKKKPGQ